MRKQAAATALATAALAAALGAPAAAAPDASSGGAAAPGAATEPRPHVVVATLDTGTNPFHPAWRRDQHEHPSEFIPGFPTDAPALDLVFADDSFEASVELSRGAFDELRADRRYPYWIPGTNIVGTWASPSDAIPIFDVRTPNAPTHGHGASASSQIAGTDLGLAPDAYVVIMDRTLNNASGGATNADVYRTNAEGLRWAADQPWIDIIHTNIQDIVPLSGKHPGGVNYPDAVAYAVSKGKLVVSAGGNWYAEPTETSPHAGPAGVLAAGANDNCGYTDFSNPDPHVVMDGYRTTAAAPNGFGTVEFGGTSSASPRISGYAAQLLLEVRRAVGYTGGVSEGALVVIDDPAARPASGPLADGRLTAAELHEVVRKTADPNPHASRWDGAQSTQCVPQPADLPFANYAKMGYGEVSEHTFDGALDVLLGAATLPQRPVEDAFYAASEQARHAFWD